MLRIAICDRDKSFQNQLLAYISKDIDIEDDYVTECFMHIIDVQKRLDARDFQFDLLFLMIDESGRDSLALVQYIREKKYDIDIFLMAKTMDFVTEAFRCKVFNYMVKPISYNKFEYELKQYLQEKREYQKEYLAVSIRGKQQMIPLNAVLYFVSDIRKIGAFFLNDETEIWFYGKLDNLEKELDKYGYLRCHQSYLINGRKIEDVTGDEVITVGGSFQISRKYAASVNEKWNILRKKLYDNAQITQLLKGVREGDISEQTMSDDSTAILSKSYEPGYSKYGIIMGMRGVPTHTSYRIYEDEILIGRDGRQVQIIISDRLVSRKHCGVAFSEKEQCYLVCDYSANGTVVAGMGELPKHQWVRVKKNSLLQLVDNNYSFMLV